MFATKVGYFTIRAFVDHEAKELHWAVKYKRKEVNAEAIDDQIANRYSGLQNINFDLKRMLEWLELAVEIRAKKNLSIVEAKMLSSLFVSIVTTYWKCFADTKGRYRIHLNADKYVPKDLSKVHETLKGYRHNYTAHSGDDPLEHGVILKVSDSKTPARFSPALMPVWASASTGDKTFYMNTQKLVQSVLEQVESEQKKLWRKLNEKWA